MNSKSKFLHRVRIHDGECGALARAMHHEGSESATLTTEPISGTSRDRLFERKQMSTKTLKRIALVAVSALGFGLMAVAPSNSAVNTPSLSLASTSGTTTVGTAGTVDATIGFLAGVASDAVTTTVLLTSAPAGNTALPTWAGSGTATNATGGERRSAGNQVLTTTAAASGAVSNVATLSLTPAVAGTYTVLVSQGTLSATWTLTATGKAAANSTSTTAVISAGTGASGDDTNGVFAPSTLNTTNSRASIVVVASNGATTGALLDADAKAKTATISGPGFIQWGAGALGRSVTSSAGTLAQTLNVYSSGEAGVATITITDGDFTKTKSLTFYGTASKAVFKEASAVLVGAGDNATVTFNATDSLNNVLGAGDNPLDFATSSDTTKATVVSAVNGVVTVTGVAAGTSTITVCNTASCTGATISATYVVTVASATVDSTKTKLAFDKATYVPGEKMVLTVSAFDANGGKIGDGVRTVFATAPAPSATLGLGSATLATTATLKDGVASYTLYAPLASGTISMAGVSGTTAVSASAVIINPAEEAANAANDAALEAIDAANAATDAANLAAEAADAATVAAEEARDAADAATAAVEALAAQVAEMIADLKTQLTALANTVAKIAKKVKA